MALSDAQRDFVASVRDRRHAICKDVASGRLSVSQAVQIARQEVQVRDLYAVKVLDVHPWLGKVAGRRLLASVGAHQFSTLASLDDQMLEGIEQAIQKRPQ
ncbi:MAG: hypothetical protein EXQ63_03015 [Ilumatobacteraceae bacterium]|nr:hypothetical protein [Ilumatobacteraceae bacterium]